MAIRQIRMYDDEVLRKKCRKVEAVGSRILQRLDDIAETMYHTDNGAGLAANQVGVLKRLAVIDMGEGPMKLINPEIVAQAGTQECIEGCLSFPNRWGKTIRPRRVTVRFLNEKGEETTLTGEGDLAKCLCHEQDHLNGALFVDKAIEFIR